MKTAALVVVTLAVVVSSAEGAVFEWFFTQADTLAEPDAPECEGKAQTCIDCYKVRTCAKLPNYKPVANTTCPKDAPYCSDGQCVATLPAGSSCADGETTSSSFQCNGDGYFPDPTDCTKYHFCVNDKATDYDCKQYPFTVYDQKTGQCRQKSEAQCFTFKCRANQVLKYQWYGPDNSIYGYCISRDEKQIKLSRCPENQRMNITDTVNPKCVPYCAQQGRFAHESDTTQFYECGGKPGHLVGPFLKVCPRGSEYDAEKQLCVIPISDDTGSSTSAPSSSSTTQSSSSSETSSSSSTTESNTDVSSSSTQPSSSTDSSSDSSSTESSSTVSSSTTQRSSSTEGDHSISSTEASQPASSTDASVSSTEASQPASSTDASVSSTEASQPASSTDASVSSTEASQPASSTDASVSSTEASQPASSTDASASSTEA